MVRAHSTRLIVVATAAAALGGPLPASAASANPSAQEVVSDLEATFGVTPGERRNHTKGTCATGKFVGTREAAAYSRAAVFSGQPIPVVARFSVAGGNPKAPDTARSARGMALELRLPDGSRQHFTMINTPVFGAARPATFRDLVVAMKPDPATGKPDPKKIAAFKASHPDARTQGEFLERHNPPASYATSAYFGIHTFEFVAAKDKLTPVRWRFVPQAGERRLTDAELKTAPADFLEPELIGRLKKGPARWDMIVTIGRPGDPEDDPTVSWPAGRKEIKAGTLTLTAATPQKGAECEKINYDPLVLVDGIAPTNDPVLRFRSPSYAVSFGKRTSGQ